jgi:primary-amine oxidase
MPRALVILAAACLAATSAKGEPLAHPMDALTAREYWTLRETLVAAGRLEGDTHVVSTELHEPPKAEVLAWKPGAPARREALVVLSRGAKAFEALVDVAGRKLLAWREVAGAQAALVPSEQQKVGELAKSDPRMVEGLKKRGITDLDPVTCYGLSPGYFGAPEDEGRRLALARCWDRRGVFNADTRPIEGLYAWIDVPEGKVVRVVDRTIAPVPKGDVDIDAEALGPPRAQAPIRVEQSLGPGFRRHGSVFEWQNWSFHLRLESRRGPVVSLVRYADAGRQRSMLYEGSLSEIFVPYMDPGESWYNSTFIDLGEYAADGLLSPMQPGEDCPAEALYFDGLVPDEHGMPRPRAKLACLFEREAGSVAWRHLNWLTGSVDSRAGRELVLRSIANLGNYDYVFDWVFQQDGSLRVVTGSTGVVNTKASASQSAADVGASEDGAYGRFVADHTVAVNHDHFFCFRLDLDVDGTANSFVVDKLVTKRLPEGSLRKSLWVVEEERAKTERDGQRDGHETGLWRFLNTAVRGPNGYPVSLQLRVGHAVSSLLSDDDYPARRAGFIKHALWVTPYKADELYAAGDYPTQSKGGDGLPAWTAADRPIENTDLVAWYTVGMHHVVRAEDWPVMPVVWHDFEIRPFDFFARNPALDLPQR